MIELESGNFYHIYNRGINGCNLFYSVENYRHFLRLYQKYIDPVAETFAWALLKNHFHLLVRIRLESEVILSSLPIPKYDNMEDYDVKLRKPHLYFSDLFNAYCKAINKQEERTGALFERPFRRLLVDQPAYFRNIIIYIHKNPEKHGFTDNFRHYPWSSYGTILSLKPTRINRHKIIGWFNSIAEFESEHEVFQAYDLFKDFCLEPEEFMADKTVFKP
ncbi:MAG: hypothetical protein HXX13_08615 [Bacteroidetes bacterium]|nr:hypothetical protein [Bacteroidota bacterium]